jgi:hypothetical protein
MSINVACLSGRKLLFRANSEKDKHKKRIETPQTRRHKDFNTRNIISTFPRYEKAFSVPHCRVDQQKTPPLEQFQTGTN